MKSTMGWLLTQSLANQKSIPLEKIIETYFWQKHSLVSQFSHFPMFNHFTELKNNSAPCMRPSRTKCELILFLSSKESCEQYTFLGLKTNN